MLKGEIKMQIEGKTRHYIEVFYNYNPDRGTQDDFTSIHVITDRNPLLYIEKYNGSKGFRFFDVDISDDFYNKEKRKNVSPIYYYGRYMTEEEINQVHEAMPFTMDMKKIIDCYCGCYITNLDEGDMTLDEYASLVNNEKINFENKQLSKKLSVECPNKKRVR